jgi:hypothetical protein
MIANGKPLCPKKILNQFKNRRVNVWMRGDQQRSFTGILTQVRGGWITVRNDKSLNIKIRLDLVGEVEHAQPNYTVTIPPAEPKPQANITYSDHTTPIKEDKKDG